MQRERGGGFTKLLAFIVGGAIGAIGGLLFAPRSGQETRERIKERADEMMEEGREQYEMQRSRMGEMAQEQGQVIRGRIEEARGRLVKGVDTAAETMREKIDTGAEKAEEAVDTAEAKAKERQSEGA